MKKIEQLNSVKVKLFRKTLRRWGVNNRRNFPWRQTNDPYRILLAEMLLQATSAAKVVPVYQDLIGRYPTPASLASASIAQIEAAIRTLGLINRAHDISKMMQQLTRYNGGVVPSEREKLLKLPRVGEYTAGAVRSFAFGLRAGIPDTNVIRLLQRFFGLPESRPSHRGSPRTSTLQAATDVLPTQGVSDFNFAMLDFGSLICTSRKPKCRACPLAPHCCALVPPLGK